MFRAAGTQAPGSAPEFLGVAILFLSFLGSNSVRQHPLLTFFTFYSRQYRGKQRTQALETGDGGFTSSRFYQIVSAAVWSPKPPLNMWKLKLIYSMFGG